MRRQRVAGDKLRHRFVHQRPECFLPRLMAADHFLFARLDHAGVLRAPAAGEKEDGKAQADKKIASQHKVPSLGIM